jgi:hypothetical protein
MFTIKEVAPSRSKSAFWQNDIKVARAIRKGNKKIDMDVIKAGLQDALQKEELARQAGGNGASNDDHPPPPKRHPHTHHRTTRRNHDAAVNFDMHVNPSLDDSAMEELLRSAKPLDDDGVRTNFPDTVTCRHSG